VQERIGNPWGSRRPHPRGTRWPSRVDVDLAAGLAPADVERWAQSARVLCADGCGLDANLKEEKEASRRVEKIATCLSNESAKELASP
jgi:hypothetical protein